VSRSTSLSVTALHQPGQNRQALIRDILAGTLLRVMTTMATTWLPPSGDALAILLVIFSVAVGVAVGRYFASTRLTVYYDGLNPELTPYGPWGDIGLMAHTRSLLDQAKPRRYVFALTLLNTGWNGIKTSKPIQVQFHHPQPLQVMRLRLADVEPNLQLLGDFSRGEVAVQFDVLKRGEAVKVLVGTNHPVTSDEVALRLDDEANLPRLIQPVIRAGHLPLAGARVIGGMDLLIAAMLLGLVYVGISLIVEVMPAWVGLSWLTPVKVLGDVFVGLVASGFCFMMINEMRHGVYALITGQYLPGPLGSQVAEMATMNRRTAAVPGRR